MERELAVSLRDVEAAEAETVRRLAADRAADRAWSGGPGVGARCGNGLFPLINLPNFILASLS